MHNMLLEKFESHKPVAPAGTGIPQNFLIVFGGDHLRKCKLLLATASLF